MEVMTLAYEGGAFSIPYPCASFRRAWPHDKRKIVAVGLEAWLGFKLFRRLPRRLELTDEGERLLAAVQPACDAVDLAINRLHGGALSGVVRLRSLPSLLAAWLVSRLPHLMRRYPAIELEVTAEDSIRSLRVGEFDMAIDLNDG